MLGITHFAVGAAGGTALNGKLGRDRLVVPVASGIFAMLPDSNKIVNTRAADVLHDTILSNLFWFHGALDLMETGHPEIEGAVALLFLLCAAVLTSKKT
jgi:hypothetical protein